jgi:hypothetical protein
MSNYNVDDQCRILNPWDRGGLSSTDMPKPVGSIHFVNKKCSLISSGSVI